MLPNQKVPLLRQFLNCRLLPSVIALILLLSFYVVQVQAKNSDETPLISPVVRQSESSAQPKPGQNSETKLSPFGKLLAMFRREEASPEEEAKCSIAATFTPEVQRWEGEICRWSDEHQMDPDLIATLMQIESCGNKNAKSSTGVRGLFQVTGTNLDGENPWDPNVSMAKGPGKVFKRALEAADGDIKAAFAGYNGGSTALDYIAGKIDRNEFYSRLRKSPSGYWRTKSKALAKINEVEWYAKWADIYFESKEENSDTLQEWINLGGHRLCTASSNIVQR